MWFKSVEPGSAGGRSPAGRVVVAVRHLPLGPSVSLFSVIFIHPRCPQTQAAEEEGMADAVSKHRVGGSGPAGSFHKQSCVRGPVPDAGCSSCTDRQNSLLSRSLFASEEQAHVTINQLVRWEDGLWKTEQVVRGDQVPTVVTSAAF